MVESAPESSESSGIEAGDKASSDVPENSLDYARPVETWPPPAGVFVGSLLVTLAVSAIGAFFAFLAFIFLQMARAERSGVGIMMAVVPFAVAVAIGTWLIYCLVKPGPTYSPLQCLAVRLGIVAAVSTWASLIVALVLL